MHKSWLGFLFHGPSAAGTQLPHLLEVLHCHGESKVGQASDDVGELLICHSGRGTPGADNLLALARGVNMFLVPYLASSFAEDVSPASLPFSLKDVAIPLGSVVLLLLLLGLLRMER